MKTFKLQTQDRVVSSEDHVWSRPCCHGK